MAQASILIVDASDAARSAMTETLREDGYLVHTARDAREAERVVSELCGALTAALLDFRSLAGEVLALTRGLRLRWPELPIIFLAGVQAGDDEALGQALLAPATALLIKPTSLDAILSAVYKQVPACESLD